MEQAAAKRPAAILAVAEVSGFRKAGLSEAVMRVISEFGRTDVQGVK